MKRFIISSGFGGVLAAGVLLGTGMAQADDTPTPAPTPAPGDWSSMIEQAQQNYDASPCGLTLGQPYPGGLPIPHLQYKTCPAPGPAPDPAP
jgi:hypothetical protein